MQKNDMQVDIRSLSQSMTYKNWRGEVATRRIIPLKVWLGSTEWHPDLQWLFTAVDVEKGAIRDFALQDCQFEQVALSFPLKDEFRQAGVDPDKMRAFVLSVLELLSDEVPASLVKEIGFVLGISERHLERAIMDLLSTGVVELGRHMGLVVAKTGGAS